MSTDIVTQEQAPLAVQDEPGGENVSGLVRLAIERGVDVEVLERLVALQERVTERNARSAFFEAVAAFQEACPEINKSKDAKIKSKRTGSEFGYSFSPLEEITRTIRPHLRNHGLSYSWDVKRGDGGLDVVCVLRHIDGHEERASFPVPVESDGRMSSAQANGAAMTYGKRQSLTAVLGLTTADVDDDARRRESELSDRQAADLDALMDEVGVDRRKFLDWLGVASISEIRASDYPRAVKALERKRGAA
jgi:hypothetical protein